MKNRLAFLQSQKQNIKIKYASEKDIKGCYQEKSLIIQKWDPTGVNLPKVPTVLFWKWLTDKPMCVEQWPLTSGKNIGTRTTGIGSCTCSTYWRINSPWNSPILNI